MSTVGKRLIESAEEALEIAKGHAEPGSVYTFEPVDVADIRKRQGLSQKSFAERYGLSAGTVRDWEQKRRNPDRAAIILLKVIDANPAAVAAVARNG